MATPADIYIAVGDLSNFERGLEACGRIMQPHGEKVWVLPGNHESAAQISRLCQKYGFRDFHEQAWQVGKYWVGGLGYSNPTPFNTPGEYTEAELGRRLAKFAALEPLVMVCHCPPYGTDLDRVGSRGFGGSTAVKEFLEAHPPEWFFCGHIHECWGVETRLGRTRAVNLGKKGYLLELPRSCAFG